MRRQGDERESSERREREEVRCEETFVEAPAALLKRAALA